MASERSVTVSIDVDPTKAESGAKRAGEAINKAGQRGATVSGTTAALDAVRAQMMAKMKADRAAASGGAAAASGAMGGGRGAVLVRLIESQFRGIMSLGVKMGAGAAGAAGAIPNPVEREKEKETQGFTRAIRSASLAILGASAAATGFVAAGNPLLFRTFTGSIQLLGTRISTLLIPAFLQASAVIQGWAETIKNLSPETKAFLGSVLKWGGILVIGTTIFVKLWDAGSALYRIFQALGAAAIFARGALLGVSAVQAATAATTATTAATTATTAATGATAGAIAAGAATVAAVAGATYAIYNLYNSITSPRPQNLGPQPTGVGGFFRGLAVGLGFMTEEQARPAAERPPMLFSHVQPAQYAGGEEFYNAILSEALVRAPGDQEQMRATLENILETIRQIAQWNSGGQTAAATAQTLGPANGNGGFLGGFLGAMGS